MNIANRVEDLSKTKDLRAQLMTPTFHLPTVSVVVVNYNYGRYLAESVESVFAQTYANVECIIVDNASTDESPTVIAELQQRYPGIVVVWRTANDGQTAASLDGFARATGQYVIFLDADDVLLPRALETHIYVHLSSRLHVGFTAGDMLQARNGDIVVATGEAMNTYIRSGRGIRTNIWRPYRAEPGWPPAHMGEDLSRKARYVPPLCMHWIWAPTSGLCYRRDALALFADNPRLPKLWTATDMYFALGLGGWCGSILIDEPVFIYRLHGSNIFSQMAQLHHTLNYQPGGSGDYNDKAIALIVDQLIGHSERFSQNLMLKLHLVIMLFGLSGPEADPELPQWARRSSAAYRLVMHAEHFAQNVGPRLTYLLMTIFGVPLNVIWDCRKKIARARKRDRH